MASTIITQMPLYTDLIYKYGATIEGQQKQFTFYWNSRKSSWQFDILNEDQTVVIQGIAIVAQYPILIDHPMADQSLSGYFVLLPNVSGDPPDITTDSSVVPELYELLYVYLTD